MPVNRISYNNTTYIESSTFNDQILMIVFLSFRDPVTLELIRRDIAASGFAGIMVKKRIK